LYGRTQNNTTHQQQVENPAFDSQTKDLLTTKASAFTGSTTTDSSKNSSSSSTAIPYTPSKAFLKKILTNTSLEADVVSR
jgi:hypothetical protein